jgi:hypothetical protein
MLRLAMSSLLAAMISAAQAPNPQSAPAQPALTTQATPAPAVAGPAAVADTQAVITIHGLCSGAAATHPGTAAKKGTPAASTRDCTTTITKAQMEKTIRAVHTNNQPIDPQMRRQIAQAYVQMLTWAAAAEKAGTEKDPDVRELLRLVRLKALADAYREHLGHQYGNPTENEITAYYNENTSKYEELKLSRIFIPAKNPSAQDKDAWEKKAAQLANDLRDRATKGEDLEKLQKETFATLGLTIAPPSTNMGERRRGMLPQALEQELFALKPGEVSKVEQEAAGYTIYKVESKQTMPIDKVKGEISRELARARMEAKAKEINTGVRVDLNESYFRPPATPGPAPSMVPPGPAARPSAAPAGAQPVASPAPEPQPTASPSAPKP